GPGEAARLVLLERADHVVLLRVRELHERLLLRRPTVGVELREAAAVEVLHVAVRAGEREVDVVEHADLARPGRAGSGRPDPFGEGPDGGGVLVVEERAVALRACHRVRRGVGGRVRIGRLRLRLRHDAGGGAERGADQEGATGLVVLAVGVVVVVLTHADSSHGIFLNGKIPVPCRARSGCAFAGMSARRMSRAGRNAPPSKVRGLPDVRPYAATAIGW